MAESLANPPRDASPTGGAGSEPAQPSLLAVEGVTVRLELPSPMRQVLDDSIPSFVAWSMEHYDAGVQQTVSQRGQKLPSVVFGDFNTDGSRDVVIDGTDGQRFLRVALVSRGDTYRLHVLDNRPVADQLRDDSIEFLVYQAPGRIDTLACRELDNDYQCDHVPFHLTADAFQAVFLEKAASLYHWTGHGFAVSGTSD